MEYEEEENNYAGRIPEFGAIFMANAATKRECFKRKVFVLPSSRENFVKHVKAGMILFLFEFEKRQLFGVYQATSDGAMNILTKAINFSGKHFPAQVCFTPIWHCCPLSEKEFQGAISENYYSAKKFNFGLSEDQVRQLLQLFSMRKLKDQLPGGQLTTADSRFASKGRRWVDQGRSSVSDRLEMDYRDEDFTSSAIHEHLENSENGDFELDNDRIFIEDRIEDEENLNSVGHDFLTDHTGGFLRKKRRVYHDRSETGVLRTCAPQPSFGTDNVEVLMNKERISAASGRYLRGDIVNDDCKFDSLAPVHGIKYSGGPSDLTKKSDYERPYCDGTNSYPIDGDRFLMNDIMKNNSLGPVITNEHEAGLLERTGKVTGNGELLLNGRLGRPHYLNNGNMPFVLSDNFENSLQRVRGATGNGKLLTSERIESEHDVEDGLTFGHFCQNFRSKQRKTDERRFPHRDKLVDENYTDGLHGSANLNASSGYDASIERRRVDECGFSKTSLVNNVHDSVSLLRPGISTQRSSSSQPQRSSVESFSRPFPNIQLSEFTESRNFRTLNSTFHDAIVTKTSPCVPKLPSSHYGRPLSIRDDQRASLVWDAIPYPFGGDFLAFSKIKSSEVERSSRCNASDFGKNTHLPAYQDHYRCHTDEFPDRMDLQSITSADYGDSEFSPSTLGSVPLMESRDFHPSNSSPLAFDGHRSTVSQGMRKYMPQLTNDEIFARNDPLSSNLSWEDWDILHQEKDLTSHGVGSDKSYITNKANDYGHYEGARGDLENHRKSVFTRLTSKQRLHGLKEKRRIVDFYADTSVDEVMDVIHRSRDFRMKKAKKFIPVVRQHDEGEMSRNVKKSHIEHGHSNFTSVEINVDANQAIGKNIDEIPKETRMVEFKRRREIKKSLDDYNAKCHIHEKEKGVSGQNAEPDFPLDKQSKRKKLVRPVFGSNHSVDGSNGNQS